MRRARSPSPAPRPVRVSNDAGPSAAARGPLALIAHQVKFDIKTSLRNPRARFFTFFFPILLLVVFNGVFGNGKTIVAGAHVPLKVFYVPGILAMSIVTAAYANLVISITTMRESGVLKRRRATPAPPALLIAGQALSAVVITAVMGALLLVIAKIAYGVGFAPASIGAMAVTTVVATITFACVAYAVAGLIGSPDAAQPLVQATMLPLWFISGRVHPGSQPEPDAQAHRRPVPRRPPRQQPPPGLGQPHVQRLDLGHRPDCARRLGGRRDCARGVAVQLAPERGDGVGGRGRPRGRPRDGRGDGGRRQPRERLLGSSGNSPIVAPALDLGEKPLVENRKSPTSTVRPATVGFPLSVALLNSK